jgi:hypothetical protein
MGCFMITPKYSYSLMERVSFSLLHTMERSFGLTEASPSIQTHC